MDDFETNAKCVALYAALRKAVRTRQMTNRLGSDWSLSGVAELPEYRYGRNKVLISATEDGEKFEVLVFNNRGRQLHSKAYKGLDAAFRNGEKFSEAVYPEPAEKAVEEAPAATEPAPRPAMKRKNIRITPKMVEALENTIKISDRMAEALTDTVLIEETHRLHSVTVGTTVALMNRGLVRYDVTLSREEGYPVHTLTPRGRYLKGCLETCPDGREFLTSVVDGGVRKLAPVAPTGKANVREVSKVLKAAGFTPYNPERGGSRSGYQASQDGPRVLVRWREGADTDMMGDTEREDTRAGLNDAYADALTAAGYPMRGRAAGGRVAVSGSKGPARYATRNTADGVHEVVDRETGHVLSTEATSYEAREMADWYNASGFTGPAPETTSPVTEYSVKIWYRSGAYEGAPHCPEDLARKIYADAVKSDGVEFAELHGPSGKLVESKTRAEESPVTTEPEQPTENLFLTGLPLLHPEPLPPAPELDYRDAACVAGDED